MSPRRASATARAAEAELAEAAPLFAALGDGTRLKLVARLSAGGPMSIARLTQGAGVTRQAISKHLAILADADLVEGARDGRESTWQLRPDKLDEAHRALDLISRRWDEALSRLREFVER